MRDTPAPATSDLKTPALNAPSPELIAQLTAIVSAGNAITNPADQAPYLKEWRDLYIGRTPIVLRPGSTAEVAAILAACNDARVAVVPQGGNTGLVGGQIPHEDKAEIVLSLTRLNRVRHVDPGGAYMVAEAGVTLLTAQETAEAAGRLFPLSLASEGSCQIGGVMATNAGGVQVLAYGNARNLALGIEAVLADGQIINGLRALKKDNTGYDLKDLLIGSEGTLGVITAVALKLLPRPAEVATAFAALSSIEDVGALFQRAEKAAGGGLTAFEFLDNTGLEMVLRHAPGTRHPLSGSHPWYVLLDVAGSRADGSAGGILEALLAEAVDDGLVLDATIAGSLGHRAAHAERPGRQNQLGSKQRQHLAAFQRHGLGHDEDHPVAARRRNEGKGDARVAGRGLDQRTAFLQAARCFERIDHVDADPVLDAGNRIEELELGQKVGLHAAFKTDALQADNGCVADGVGDRIVDQPASRGTVRCFTGRVGSVRCPGHDRILFLHEMRALSIIYRKCR
jgi:FAD/FMN-containing dehydrogenase